MVAEKKFFSWEEVGKHNSSDSAWLVINNKVYDVTTFLERHPGGDMILLGAGRDATELFESHHFLSVTENTALLEKFYIGDMEKPTVVFNPKSKTDYYRTLKLRVEKYFKDNKIRPRDSVELYIKGIISIAISVALYYGMFYAFESFFLSFICAVLFGWSVANLGMGIMHDGNHGGYSDSALMNRIAGGIFDVMGGSSFVWKMIHGIGHHTYTNIEELDPDIRTADPHFRRIKKIQPSYSFYKYQHYYMPFMYTMLVFELFVRDFMAMLRGYWAGVRFQPIPRSEWILFWVCKAWYLSYNFAFPLMYGLPLWRVLTIYAVQAMVTSELLVLVFQINHVVDHSEFYNVDKSGVVNADWAEMQTSGSSNFATGSWLWNHLTGGLNHQIEHHLFPAVCHIHYPAISRIVKQTSKEFNVRYNEYPSCWAAICGHFNHLRLMGQKGYKFMKPNIS